MDEVTENPFEETTTSSKRSFTTNSPMKSTSDAIITDSVADSVVVDEKVHLTPTTYKRRGRKSVNSTPSSSAAFAADASTSCLLCRQSTDDENLLGKFLECSSAT